MNPHSPHQSPQLSASPHAVPPQSAHPPYPRSPQGKGEPHRVAGPSEVLFDYGASTLSKILNLLSPTRLGLLTLASGALVYFYLGVDRQDMILRVFGLAIGLISVVFILLAYVEWWRITSRGAGALSDEVTEAEVGQTLLTGFRLPSVNLNPLFQLKVSWVEPAASDYQLELYQGELHELIQPARRGRLSSVVRRFQLEDLFGLTEITWYARQACQLRFLPESAQTPPTQIQQPQEGEDQYDPVGQASGDLVELRRYQHGDPLRLLLWRVYARNRQLIVRSPERAFSLKHDLIAYAISHPTDEASASTARAYLESGLLGDDYQLFADGCLGAARDELEGMEHLISSARGATLEALPQLLAIEPQKLRGCIIFASALTPLSRLLELTEALPSPPLIILSMRLDASAQAEQRGGLRELFTKPSQRRSSPLRSVNTSEVSVVVETYEELSALGRPPVLIAQPEGREVSPEALRALQKL